MNWASVVFLLIQVSVRSVGQQSFAFLPDTFFPIWKFYFSTFCFMFELKKIHLFESNWNIIVTQITISLKFTSADLQDNHFGTPVSHPLWYEERYAWPNPQNMPTAARSLSGQKSSDHPLQSKFARHACTLHGQSSWVYVNTESSSKVQHLSKYPETQSISKLFITESSKSN